MKYTRKDAKAHSRATMRGVWAAANTPFHADGSIHEDLYRRNVDHWINDLGIDGLFIAGKQGEFFSMSIDERKRMFDLSVEMAGDKAQTIMSCSDQNMTW
ncbi:N-acetylneuraminate lyase [Aminobacter sp. MSH1]|uniref:dihydrodipicolinate synthase family protein n=1 Tax=Aminobacter sp. MSH1 TaxID=374606 RepID=UPI000D504BD1|nr:dihydrodipicolinate synthase family protein [Aminobacter sp. MSH1]AWC23139.1 N-acetylneuraminate lyase [Aminobacter sp. MSH1]